MLAFIIASFTLSNAWAPPFNPVPTVRDINGVAINVGSNVKLQGVVTGMVPLTGQVNIQFTNPNPSSTPNPIIQVMNINLIVGS